MLIATYPWAQNQSNFGNVYVPLASIEVQHTNGEWIRYVFKIDSGAVVTAMGSQYCKDLGIKFGAQARKEILEGVMGRKDTYYIHKVNMRFQQKVITEVPIAFSHKEMPGRPLLGRLDVFNKFGIYFNPWDRNTSFSDQL